MKYTVEAIRSGNWWAITVPEIKGFFSQARRLDRANREEHAVDRPAGARAVQALGWKPAISVEEGVAAIVRAGPMP